MLSIKANNNHEHIAQCLHLPFFLWRLVAQAASPYVPGSDLFRVVIDFHLQYGFTLFLCFVGLTDEYAP